MMEAKVLAVERQRAILRQLRQIDFISVKELCSRYGVSPNTIRRDLKHLQKSRFVTVVRGGALITENVDMEIPFPKRQVSAVSQKMEIGRRAAQLIENDEAIILDAGTTTHAVAKAVRSRSDLTVITNALNIAQELADCPNIVTIVAGGIIRGKSNCLIGAMAEQTFSEWHVNKAFISAGGLDPEAGLTNTNPFEVPVKQAMIRAAQRVILVIGSEKIGHRSLAPFAPLSAVHIIVTDSGITAEQALCLRERGVELIIAGEGDDD